MPVEVLMVTHDPELKAYRNRELVQRLRNRDVPVTVVAPAHLAVTASATGPRLWHINGRRLQPSIVLNALYKNSGVGLDAVRILERAGFPVINRADAWYAAKLKPLASVYLTAAGIPHPPTLFSYSTPAKVATQLFKRSRYVVFKPPSGSLGYGMVRYRNSRNLVKRLREWRSKNRYVHAQAFVRNPGRDIRAVVIGNQVVGATYRIAPPGSWRTNVTSGGTPKNCPVSPQIRDLSLRATRALGLDIAGVDLIEGKNGLQVLELNAWPNYELYDAIVGIDVADVLARYIISRARQA